jgi:hypothetical protein
MSPRLNEHAFSQYFSARTNYKNTGWYVNEDTGVYFNFEYRTEPVEEGDAAGRVAFNLNYYRPHVFGLEAEPEVSAFVQAFDCTIHDPQMDGMGDGPYSAVGFLNGWNRGNLFGYEAIVAKSDLKDVLLADESLIESVWRWNLQRQTCQSEFGEDRFVPRAHWARRRTDGALVVYAVWGEGVWIALPDCVTHVLLVRNRTVSKGWLKGKEKVMETKLLSLDDVALLDGCEWRPVGGNRLLLGPVAPPVSRQVAAIFESPFEQKSPIEPFSTDHVLGTALMSQAKPTAGR